MNRKLLITAALLLGAAALSLGSAASPGSEPALRLLVLGDSLSASYGLSLHEGWVSRMADRLREAPATDALAGHRVEVVNASISGETTAGGLERLPDLLAQQQPDAVIIALGANDGLRGFDLAEVAARLERMIELIRSDGASVLLIGVRLPPNYGAAYGEGFQRLFAGVAERTGVRLVPRMLDGVAERWDLMQPDGLHPTAAAQPLILDTVWPEVLGVLREAAHEAQAAAASGNH